jgi:hypothetical protein
MAIDAPLFYFIITTSISGNEKEKSSVFDYTQVRLIITPFIAACQRSARAAESP